MIEDKLAIGGINPRVYIPWKIQRGEWEGNPVGKMMFEILMSWSVWSAFVQLM